MRLLGGIKLSVFLLQKLLKHNLLRAAMTWSKMITLLRIAFLPIVVYLIFQESASTSSWAFLLLCSMTLADVLYHALSKRRDKKVGSFLEPFLDKFIVIVLLFVFVLEGSFWLSLLFFFILRDLAINVLRWMAARDDVILEDNLQARFLTNLQLGLVFSLILHSLIIEEVGLFLIVFFTLLSVIVGLGSLVFSTFLYLQGYHQRKQDGRRLEREQMIILANTKSRGFKEKYRRHLLRLFARRRKASLHYLSLQKEMFSPLREEIKQAKQIIIAGGDGSFESALNHPLFQKKSLGFFPLGAGNALYAYFYRGKRFEYLRSRFHFQEVDLDVLELEWEKGKKQTLFMSVGVDAEVARLSSQRTKRGFFDYVSGSAKAAAHARANYDFICSVDGKRYHWENCVNLTLGKVPYYGYSLRSLLGEVHPHNGEVYGVACLNAHSVILNKTVRLWGLFLAALGLEKSPLLALKGKEFIVKSKEIFPIQAGGDFLGYTKWAKVRVVRKQKVLMI